MTIQKYLLFIAGQIGMMSLARFLLQWLIEFANFKVDGIGATLFVGTMVGGTLFAFRFFDGITDPIAGTLSDSWVRKGRKRQTLLLFSFAVPALGLILTFLPNHDMPVTLRWVFLCAGLFIFFVGYTFYAIPYWSLVDDYSDGNEKVRSMLSTLLGVGIILATAIGFGLSPFLIGKNAEPRTEIGAVTVSQAGTSVGAMVGSGAIVGASVGISAKVVGEMEPEEGANFFRGAWVFALMALILMPLPFFAAPKGWKPPDPPEGKKPPSLWQNTKTALSHRRFVSLIALFAGSQMSFTIMTAAAGFIAVDILGGNRTDVPFILGPLLAVALPCFLLVPKVSRKIGWEKGMMFGSLGLGVVYLLSGGLGMSIVVSPIITAAILFALGGPMLALLFGLEPEGVVDCARERGGEDTVSIYFGVFNFIVKTLNGIAIFITGWLTTLSEEHGVIAIRSMSFVAGGCLLIGVLAYFFIKRGAKPPPPPPETRSAA